MIDRFSSHWKEACDLVDYTYPEDLESWKCPDNGIVDIHSPVLDKLSPGDVIYMNAINYSYFFLFCMLRPAILDYIPFAMLSCSNEAQDFQIGCCSASLVENMNLMRSCLIGCPLDRFCRKG